MRILFIHKGFPGQFKHLIPALMARGDEIWAITNSKAASTLPSGISVIPYKELRGNGKDTFPLASEFETKIIRGESVARSAIELANKGFRPDVIVGHPGWGEMLFLGDIWPTVPELHYVEFFYAVTGTDNDIDDIYAKPQTWRLKAKARVKNAHLLSNLNRMSAGITPTRFQHRLLPPWAQARTAIIHDGVDTEWLSPNKNETLRVSENLIFQYGDPVITFVNRTFEPYRGVHIFLEALSKLQKENRSIHTILVGNDTSKVSYGEHRSDGIGWLTTLKRDMGDRLDWNRIHHLGVVSHETLRKIYRISASHVYLSYPFVVSWSLLEAMSCGTLVVGSSTEPVKEIIKHKENGLLVPFTSPNALFLTLKETVENPTQFLRIRRNARESIKEFYELKKSLAKQIDLVDQTFTIQR